MIARFLSPANEELEETILYYEHEMTGLGLRFLREVDAAVERILLFPDGWARIGPNTRRCLIKGFPYALYYIRDGDQAITTAVANFHRDPRRYRSRVK